MPYPRVTCWRIVALAAYQNDIFNINGSEKIIWRNLAAAGDGKAKRRREEIKRRRNAAMVEATAC